MTEPYIILHSYTKPYTVSQEQTLDFVSDLRKLNYAVISMKCGNEEDGGLHDYENIMRALWPLDLTLITLERDNVPTIDMINRMINCPEPYCSQAYRLHRSKMWTHRTANTVPNNRFPGDTKFYYEEETVDFATHVGLGLTKFSVKRHELDINKLEPNMCIEGSVEYVDPLGVKHKVEGWLTFDTRLCNLFWLAGKANFHIHWPEMVHNDYDGNLVEIDYDRILA